MALTINTNISSLIAQRNLNNATSGLTSAIEKMTTGFKINHAADNAAGCSISNMWVTQLGSLDVASDNAATGADMLTTAEETYSLLTAHLQRVRDLTEQAANGTYGSQSLKAIQSEIVARFQEIDRIAANAEFNGIKLMDGTAGTIELQVGLYADGNSQITLDSSLFGSASTYGLFNFKDTTTLTAFNALLGAANTVAGTTVAGLNADATREATLQTFAAACSGLVYSTADKTLARKAAVKPKDMLQYIDATINDISKRVTNIGAAQNRVESAVSALSVQSQNLTSSLSTLRDTDVAKESSNYLQAQILQQASATLLATANQLPSIALNLI